MSFTVHRVHGVFVKSLFGFFGFSENPPFVIFWDLVLYFTMFYDSTFFLQYSISDLRSYFYRAVSERPPPLFCFFLVLVSKILVFPKIVEFPELPVSSSLLCKLDWPRMCSTLWQPARDLMVLIFDVGVLSVISKWILDRFVMGGFLVFSSCLFFRFWRFCCFGCFESVLLCGLILSDQVFYSSSITINFCHTDAYDLSSFVH